MGEVLERPGRRAEVKVSRDEIVAFEFEMAPKKDGAGAHFHKQHVDSFYVVEGELELTVAGEVVHARPGDLVHVEPAVTLVQERELRARALSERAHARDALRRVHPADGRGRRSRSCGLRLLHRLAAQNAAHFSRVERVVVSELLSTAVAEQRGQAALPTRGSSSITSFERGLTAWTPPKCALRAVMPSG